MRFPIVSDLHLEFRNPIPWVAPGAETIVVAGDPAPIATPWLRRVADEWVEAAHVLYVSGNHEFRGVDIDEGRTRLAEACATLGVTLLDRGAVTLGGVRFIGATPWTDFRLNGIHAEPAAHRASLSLSDFDGWILHRTGTGRFTTHESARRHGEARAFIERELAAARETGTTAVVITHHAPTPRSIAPRYHGHPCTSAFASDLERVIGEYQPALWIHGHVHNSVDERLGHTRVLANPGGYTVYENRAYDPTLCVDI